MKQYAKLLPNQDENSKLYEFDGLAFEESMFELSSSLIDYQFPAEEHPDKSQTEMGSSIILQAILSFFIRSRGGGRVLEIGTFMGMSAISFAKEKDVIVDSIEKYQSFADVARVNIKGAGCGDRVNVIVGEALNILESVQKKYDIIFIDGDKENYLTYFQKSVALLNSSGVIIVDDIFFHGDVFNAKPKTARGMGVKMLTNYLKTQKETFRFTVLPISNGLLIAEFR